jgi:hypothetical protein
VGLAKIDFISMLKQTKNFHFIIINTGRLILLIRSACSFTDHK